MIKAIDTGYPQKEISEAAFIYQKELEKGERTIVGINKYVDLKVDNNLELHKVDQLIEINQVKRLRTFKSSRNPEAVLAMLNKVREACINSQNVMPILIEAVGIGITLGEISNIYRDVFGRYHDPGMI